MHLPFTNALRWRCPEGSMRSVRRNSYRYLVARRTVLFLVACCALLPRPAPRRSAAVELLPSNSMRAFVFC